MIIAARKTSIAKYQGLVSYPPDPYTRIGRTVLTNLNLILFSLFLLSVYRQLMEEMDKAWKKCNGTLLSFFKHKT